MTEHLQEQIDAQEQLLDALHQLMGAMLPARDLPSLCRAIFSVLTTVLPLDGGFLEDYDSSADQMITRYGIEPAAGFEDFPNDYWNYRTSAPTTWLIQNHEAVVFNNLPSEVKIRFPNHQFREFGDTSKTSHSWMSVPLLVNDELVGLINIQCYAPDKYGPNEVQMLHLLAQPIAVVWSNMNLITRTEQSIADLRIPMTLLTDDILVIPLVQGLDNIRLNEGIETILEMVTQQAIEHVLFDFTAVEGYEADLVQMISLTVRALELSGAQTMLIGLHPTLIEGLLHSGVDFADLRVTRDLPSALRSLSV